MATKLGRMLTYFGGLLPIKPHEPLITWFCDNLKSLYQLSHQRRRSGVFLVNFEHI